MPHAGDYPYIGGLYCICITTPPNSIELKIPVYAGMSTGTTIPNKAVVQPLPLRWSVDDVIGQLVALLFTWNRYKVPPN